MHYRMRPALPFHGARLLAGLALILAWLALPAAAPRAQASPAGTAAALPAAADFAADAALERQRRLPILVLYTQDDCSWCEKLRREYLAPMQLDPAAPVLIRQIDIDRDTPLIDWDGKSTTHRDFALRNRVRLTPIVAFLGPSGEVLAEPIVGVPTSDFYTGILERRIDEATNHLRGTLRP